MARRGAILALSAALCAVACATTKPDQRWQDGREAPAGFEQLAQELHRYEPALDELEGDGPFSYQIRPNVAFEVGREVILADVLVAEGASKAPLVVMVHGNHSRKEAHRYQAEHLASFGMHVVVLQLKNRAQWMKNGRLVAALVKKIAKRPRLVSPRVDKRRIILVGHSFGGSAITVAAGRGAPVKGLILLDPAVVDTKVKRYMKKVEEPAVLLGADRSVYRARKRPLFQKHLAGPFAEVSVRGATHDDAQHPSMFSLAALGFDPFTSREKQRIFSTAIVASAFSIATTGGVDWAWSAFQPEAKRGVFKNARRNLAKKDE